MPDTDYDFERIGFYNIFTARNINFTNIMGGLAVIMLTFNEK